jgi:hypothetical protein
MTNLTVKDIKASRESNCLYLYDRQEDAYIRGELLKDSTWSFDSRRVHAGHASDRSFERYSKDLKNEINKGRFEIITADDHQKVLGYK